MRTALLVDGSYASIGFRDIEQRHKIKLNYVRLRQILEEMGEERLVEAWYFDSYRHDRGNPSNNSFYRRLKLAPPEGPQFQVKVYKLKKYHCKCTSCGNRFTQNVQQGCDNGITTKLLSLAYEGIADRIILFAGDGDFYDSLSHVRNVLRKDIWILGYRRNSMSADVQQVASRVLWMEDLWPRLVNNAFANVPSESTNARHHQPSGYANAAKKAATAASGAKPPSASDAKPSRKRSTEEAELQRVMEMSLKASRKEEFGEAEAIAKALSLSLSGNNPTWECEKCTFQNSDANLCCEMCEAKRTISLID